MPKYWKSKNCISLEWIFLAYATSLIPSPFIEVPYRIRQMSGHAYVCQWYWF